MIHNSVTRGWHNSSYYSLINITVKFILQNGKKAPIGVQEKQQLEGLNTLSCSTHATTFNKYILCYYDFFNYIYIYKRHYSTTHNYITTIYKCRYNYNVLTTFNLKILYTIYGV